MQYVKGRLEGGVKVYLVQLGNTYNSVISLLLCPVVIRTHVFELNNWLNGHMKGVIIIKMLVNAMSIRYYPLGN